MIITYDKHIHRLVNRHHTPYHHNHINKHSTEICSRFGWPNMVQTIPKHRRKLHTARIQMLIPSDVHNDKSFITLGVLFCTYPSWGSKFIEWAGLSQYVVRCFPFHSQWFLSFFTNFILTFTFSNIPSQLVVGFIPKFFMSSNCLCNQSYHIPVAFSASRGRISSFTWSRCNTAKKQSFWSMRVRRAERWDADAVYDYPQIT